MTESTPAELDASAERLGAQRVLVLTPTGRDSEVAASLLAGAGLEPHVCAHVNVLADEVRRRGAGALLVAEEAIATGDASALTRLLGEQEAWSDVPIIIITLPGVRSPDEARRAYAMLGPSGNVTLLERPFRAATLVSAVQVALRSRRRQYEIRDLLGDVRRGEEQLRLAVRTGRLGVWRLDLATRELHTSDICRANYGQPLDEPFTHERFWRTIHPDDAARVRAAMDGAIAAGGDYETEYRVVWSSGSVRWILARGRVGHDATGRAATLGGVSLDITERKATEEQREQSLEAERAARAEAERLGRMKDEFLATLSHELRTPLNAILGWSQLLNRGDDKLSADQRRKALETIERNARIQAEMIEDLLDMSRIISGKLKLQPAHIDLAAAVTSAAATVATAAQAKGVRLEVDVRTWEGRVYADGNRLQQVIWNLLNNAVKFTPAGGLVRARLCRHDGDAVISVSDTGRGIDPAFLPYVFERFRQADGSITRSFGGLGLGLAIVKQLVELHGGTVGVDSAGSGRGATFHVTLPARATLEDPDVEVVPAPDAPTGQDADGRVGDDVRLDGLRVLLVDDDVDGLELVQRILAECGARVTAAHSAADALRYARAEPFDLLVSDIGMPDQDGYALIGQVRRMTGPGGDRLPAIALTAFARDADRARALAAGFDAHMSKPVEPGSLVNLVKSLSMPRVTGDSPPATRMTKNSTNANSMTPDGERLNILIVDDTQVVAEVLAQIFDSLGERATVAHGGAEAIELLTRGAPGDGAAPSFDVIISDISMPGMNGHELGARLHALREAGTIRPRLIVAMSGYSEPAEKQRSLASGFDRHIVKPPEMHELEKLVGEVRGMREGRGARGEG